MTTRVLLLGLVIIGAGCAKSVSGTETGNPPAIATSSIMVEAIGKERVRVSGEAGAITPGGGEVAVTNTSRDAGPVVADVEENGSFSVELEGVPEDDYEVVASDTAGHSLARTISGDGGPSSDWHALHLCDDSDPMDALNVTALRIEADTLHVSVSHGGGCAQHGYGLCYGSAWAESYPIQVGFRVLHDDGGDRCDALLTKELTFDLTPFKRAYADAYRTDAGAVNMGFSACQLEDRPAGPCRVLYEWGDSASECGPPIGATCPPFELPNAPTTWAVQETKCNFSFRGPDDLIDLHVQGTDSCVAELENDTCTFNAGSGGFSNGLTEFEDADEYEVGRAIIDGYSAKVVTAVRPDQPRPYLAGAHFPEPPFAEARGVTADLVIFCSTREQRDAMLGALGTIRFD